MTEHHFSISEFIHSLSLFELKKKSEFQVLVFQYRN